MRKEYVNVEKAINEKENSERKATINEIIGEREETNNAKGYCLIRRNS